MPGTRCTALTLFIAVTMTLSGCAGDAAVPMPTSPSLDVDQITTSTTDSQRAMLADGNVTFAEYSTATTAALACLRRTGFSVRGPFPRGTDPRFLEFTVEGNGAPGERRAEVRQRVTADSRRCEREFRADVARVWESQHLLTPQERERQRPLVITCLREEGIVIADTAPPAAIFRMTSRSTPAVDRCRSAHPDFFIAGAGQ